MQLLLKPMISEPPHGHHIFLVVFKRTGELETNLNFPLSSRHFATQWWLLPYFSSFLPRWLTKKQDNCFHLPASTAGCGDIPLNLNFSVSFNMSRRSTHINVTAKYSDVWCGVGIHSSSNSNPKLQPDAPIQTQYIFGNPTHGRGIRTRWPLRFLPVQAIPWFYDSVHPSLCDFCDQAEIHRSVSIRPAIWWRMLQLLLWTLWSHIPPPRTHHEPQKGSVGGCGNGEVGGWEAKGPGTSTGPISAWEVSPSHRQVDLETSPEG